MIDEREAAIQLLAAKVGFVLRTARLRRRMTLEEVSEIIGASVRTLRKLERGEHYDSLRLLGEMAWALDVEIEFTLVPRQDWPASRIEAASADETRSGSAEGESPAPEGGDAQ